MDNCRGVGARGPARSEAVGRNGRVLALSCAERRLCNQHERLHCCTVSLHASCCLAGPLRLLRVCPVRNPPAPMHARAHTHVPTQARTARSRFRHRLSHAYRTRIRCSMVTTWGGTPCEPCGRYQRSSARACATHAALAWHRDISGRTRRQRCRYETFLYTPTYDSVEAWLTTRRFRCNITCSALLPFCIGRLLHAACACDTTSEPVGSPGADVIGI